MDFNKYFDHTLLKADATESQIRALCEQAASYDVASVCVNSSYVPLCVSLLKGTNIKTCCVVGFPLGAMSTDGKLAETESALACGAQEIDTVIHIGWLKDGKHAEIKEELTALAERCHAKGALLKVIIETCLLTEEEKITACQLVTESGADFIKTSTGFSTGGATLEDVKLMRAHIGPGVKIKAAGGIRTLADALAFIRAGADRLGCSASTSIIEAYNKAR